jgi:hypothetical protein
MIKEVTMYTAICDNCGIDNGADSDYSCWNTEGFAIDNALEDDWIEHEDQLFCSDCYSYDDEGEIVINVSRKDKYKTTNNGNN